MIIFLVISFVWPCLQIELTDAGALSCYRIPRCKGTFNAFVMNHHNFAHNLRDHETEIGKSGHWNGFKPDQYNLNMFFRDFTNYTGSVEISGIILQATNSLAVNVDHNYVSYNEEHVSIIRCTSVFQRPHICIQGMTHYSGLNYTVVSLNDTLLPQEQCIIRFPRFHSHARRDGKNNAAIGLRISEGKNSMAIVTDFGLRYARTVFPCMDHPALRARFNFTIVHPAQFRIVSNTPLMFYNTTWTSAGYAISVFNLTVPLSTNMFGFALLTNYIVLPVSLRNSFRILVQISDKEQLQWVPKVYYEDMNGNPDIPSVPTYKITCIILSSMPKYSISSYGLTILDGEKLKKHGYGVEAKLLLRETILRQYLGAIVTVSDWSEVCLLEGLVEYFKFILKESLRKKLGVKLETGTHVNVCRKYGGRSIGDNKKTIMDTNNCDERAWEFFHSISKIFKQRVMKRFFDNLMTRYSYGTAGLNEWDDVLPNVIDQGSSLTGYLKHYFLQSAPVVVFVSLSVKTFSVRISFADRDSYVSPIPLKIYLPTLLGHESLILPRNGVLIQLSSSNPWVLVDPDRDTCAIIFYNDAFISLISEARYDPFGILRMKARS